MPKWNYIDTTGLEDHFDCADLLAQGLTKKQIIEWMNARIKPGAPPAHVEPVKSDPPKKKKAVKKKPKPEPIPVQQDNVTALKLPVLEDDYGFPPEFSEDALAGKFTKKFKDKLSFCGAWKAWQVWDGSRWSTDDSFESVNCARTIVKEVNRDLMNNTELGDKRKRMANAIATHRTMSSIVAIARSDREHVIRPADFDADPWTLNTPDGVIELRTGNLRPARRDDYCRKMTMVGPSNKKPTLWLDYLEYATQGDAELMQYLQRIAGYCLTGSIAEHAFFFLYGDGGTGKGTYKDMLDWMLQDYAVASNIDTFTEQRFQKHSSEIAYFHGARLVTAPETDEGSRWAESRIKSMTGGDPITAAFKHQNEFTFLPLFKLLFAGNHKPQLRSVDNSIKRRLYLIPFEHQVTDEQKDIHLPKKLRETEVAQGIMHWMIEGCLDWQANMLQPPNRVKASTADYLESEDRIGRFLEEHVYFDPPARIKTSLLFSQYKFWADIQNEYALSRPRFLKLLRQKGFRSEKRGGDQVIMGMGALAPTPQ